MEALFAGITPTASYKADGENNPLFTQRFGADPGVMDYSGRVYVYATNDVFEFDCDGKKKKGHRKHKNTGKQNQLFIF